jgi:hypothetical protein
MTSQTDNTPPPPPQPGERGNLHHSNCLTSLTSTPPSQDVGSTITSAILLPPPSKGENGEPFTTVQSTPGQWTTPLLVAVPCEVITEPVTNYNGFNALASYDASSTASAQPVANISHSPQATALLASLLQDISAKPSVPTLHLCRYWTFSASVPSLLPPNLMTSKILMAFWQPRSWLWKADSLQLSCTSRTPKLPYMQQSHALALLPSKSTRPS